MAMPCRKFWNSVAPRLGWPAWGWEREEASRLWKISTDWSEAAPAAPPRFQKNNSKPPGPQDDSPPRGHSADPRCDMQWHAYHREYSSVPLPIVIEAQGGRCPRVYIWIGSLAHAIA